MLAYMHTNTHWHALIVHFKVHVQAIRVAYHVTAYTRWLNGITWKSRNAEACFAIGSLPRTGWSSARTAITTKYDR